MAGPWEKYAAPDADLTPAPAGPWTKHGTPPDKPEEPATTVRGIAKNVAAGAIEGGTAVANIASNPSGNIIGKPLATGAVFLHDLIAPWFGGERFPDKVRNALLQDTVPQPGTRAVGAIGDVVGVDPAAVPANTPAEQIARKVAGAAVATGGAGVGPAVVASGGAVAGDVAGRVVPEWAQPAAELGGNVAGGIATSRAVTPVRTVTTPERQRLVAELDAEGVPLTAGERTGSKPLMKTEQILGQTPGAAGGIASDVSLQQASLNRAVARRAGLDADTLTPEVLNKHLDTVGGEIGALAQANSMQLPTQFLQDVGKIRQTLRYEKTAVAQELGARIDQLRDMITVDAQGNPVLAGKHYQNLVGDLRKAITGSDDAAARGKLIEFRDKLRQQMEASMSPEDAARWRELNRHYANGMVIQDAMGGAGAGAAEGNISLLQLRTALNRSMGNDAYAKGYGDLNDLARAGQSVLRKPPDSGSPQGIAINALLKGLPLATGAGGGYLLGGVEGYAAGIATPWAISTAMRGRIPGTNVSPGQAYLANQLTMDVDPRVTAAITQAANAETQRNRR